MGDDADPVLAGAHQLVRESLKELRASLEGLSADALNWRASAGMNSVAVLATHAMHATRLWLSLAVNAPLPERDRGAEFSPSGDNPEALLRMVDDLSLESLTALELATNVEWGAMRATLGRGGDAPPAVPAAYALIHATEHLRGHVDQLSMTRQLWEQTQRP